MVILGWQWQSLDTVCSRFCRVRGIKSWPYDVSPDGIFVYVGGNYMALRSLLTAWATFATNSQLSLTVVTDANIAIISHVSDIGTMLATASTWSWPDCFCWWCGFRMSWSQTMTGTTFRPTETIRSDLEGSYDRLGGSGPDVLTFLAL